MSTTRRISTGSPCRPALSRQPVSPASRLAAAPDTSPASMASPSTICSRPMSCSPTVAFVTANKSENADLYWGLRGGGGNFGIVTSFLFQPHPVNMVYAGPVFWDLEDARTIMQKYRDFLPRAPEELGAFVGLKTVPPVDRF